MKSSLFRSLVMFALGAGSATVIAGLYPYEPIEPEQFLERATVLLAEIEALGGYVGIAQDGRVGIYTNPVGACVYPPPPPKWPTNAVDQRSLELGFLAIGMINKSYLASESQPVYVLGKCRPYAQSMLK